MAKKRANTPVKPVTASEVFETLLLVLCLCIVALRVTYTEAPTAQTFTQASSLTDTIYSLTLSGLLIFAFVLWLAWRLYTGRRGYRLTGIEIGLVLFVLAALLSGIAAANKRLAMTHTIMLLGPILGALLLVQILNRPLKIKLVLIVVAALGIVTTYQCAEQFLVSNDITIEQYEQSPETLLGPLGIEQGTFRHFLFEHRLYSRGVRGFFTTSNSAASFAILALFAGLVLLLRRWRRRERPETDLRYRLLPAAAVTTILAGLLLTQSTGGMLGLAAAGSLSALLWHVYRHLGARRKVALTILSCLALLAAVGVVWAGISYGLQHGRLPGGNSMLVRWQYWVASAQMYADHPLLGVGGGNFASYYPHYKPPAALESVADPHNFLLSVLTQFGPLGLLGFLAMVSVPLWRCVARATGRDAGNAVPRPSPKRLTIAVLFVICGCLLMLRPILIPATTPEQLDVLLYEIMALYVTPVGAFLIGFLLLAAPLQGKRQDDSGISRTVLVVTLAGAVLGVLVHNVIDFAIFEPGVWTTFWVIMACLLAGDSQRQTDLSPAKHAKPLAKACIVFVALALLVVYWLFVWRPVYVATMNIGRAQRAASIGQFDRAHDLLDAAFEADPLSAAPLSMNGRLYMERYARTRQRRTDWLDRAAECFERAVRVSPADYKNYERLGDVYRDLGRHEKAFDWYDQATQFYPGCGRLWLERARAADQLGRSQMALISYCKAVAIEDSYRRQFKQMYPNWQRVVSRLGEDNDRFARKRIAELDE